MKNKGIKAIPLYVTDINVGNISKNSSSYKGGETMDKTKMAIIAGIVLCVIVGCIAGGVFN